MVEGHHTSFIFACESAEDRSLWINAINKQTILSRMTRDLGPAAPTTSQAGSHGRGGLVPPRS